MKYFKMSTRFNKQKPEDFEMEYIYKKFISSEDGSEWIQCQLYDYGWGKENGFYKKPLGTFYDLMDIVIDTSDNEDSYGAASIIEDLYSDDLKFYLQNLMNQPVTKKLKTRLCKIFKLNSNINKTYKKDYSFEQNNNEHLQWKKIGEFFSK